MEGAEAAREGGAEKGVMMRTGGEREKREWQADCRRKRGDERGDW